MSKRTSILIPAFVVLAAVLVVLPHLMGSDYTKQLLVQALIYVVIVVGYNFVTGDIGQLSMAQQGFFAIGAYSTALLATKAGWPWWATLLGAMALTGVIGALVGIPTLRVRGQYLIMVTMGFSEIVRLVATNWSDLTGGASGVTKIPSPAFGGWTFESKTSIYYLFLVIAIIMVLVAWRVRKTKYGRAFLAIRDGELAADVMGLNTTYVKILAFSLSAIFAAVGGTMFASSFNYISPDTFGLGQTVLILAMLLIGGEGSIAGAVVGAIILTYLPEMLRFASDYYMFIYGGMILLITLFLPGGVVGWARRFWVSTLGPRLLPSTVESVAKSAAAQGSFTARDLFAKNLPLGSKGPEPAPEAADKEGDAR